VTGVATTRSGRRDPSRTVARLAYGLLVAAISWGAFAFGAVYPWAYWPLAVVALIITMAGAYLSPPAGASKQTESRQDPLPNLEKIVPAPQEKKTQRATAGKGECRRFDAIANMTISVACPD